VAVAQRVGLLASEMDGQFDLERRGGMTQIDQGEIRKLEVVGDLKPESAGVEVQRSCLIEYADHRMNGLCHSVQLLQIGDDGGAGLRLGLAVGHVGAWDYRLRVGEIGIKPSVIPDEVGLGETGGIA